jgi:hypothetical protein
MPDPELAAMEGVNDAIKGLEPEAQLRVLRWATSRYGLADTSPGPVRSSAVYATQPAEETSAASVGDLVHAAGASAGPEQAMVVAYWLQSREGREGWSGAEVNDALKNLGHGQANITATLTRLIKRKPALVMQIGKTGRSQQARKTYKLTAAGTRAVEDMLHSGDGSK